MATEVADPDEYARLFALAEKIYAGYGDYRAKTALGRASDPLLSAQTRASAKAL